MPCRPPSWSSKVSRSKVDTITTPSCSRTSKVLGRPGPRLLQSFGTTTIALSSPRLGTRFQVDTIGPPPSNTSPKSSKVDRPQVDTNESPAIPVSLKASRFQVDTIVSAYAQCTVGPRRRTDSRLIQSSAERRPRRSCPRRCPNLRLIQYIRHHPIKCLQSSKVSKSQVDTMGSLQNGIPPAGMPFCY